MHNLPLSMFLLLSEPGPHNFKPVLFYWNGNHIVIFMAIHNFIFQDNPCKHNSTCTDDINKFTCSCMPGYEGDICDTDIDECSSGKLIQCSSGNVSVKYNIFRSMSQFPRMWKPYSRLHLLLFARVTIFFLNQWNI